MSGRYVPGAVIGGLNSRRGTIIDSEVREDEFTVVAEVALNDMFGYASFLRGQTQGKGEFSMEYKVSHSQSVVPHLYSQLRLQKHLPVMPDVQAELHAAYKQSMPSAKK